MEEWKALAQGDARLEQALEALHVLFKDADTLGSLIDPRRAIETSAGEQVSFDDVQWDEVSALLEKALTREAADPATAVLGADAAGIARAADCSRAVHACCDECPVPNMAKQTAPILRLHGDRFPARSLSTLRLWFSLGLRSSSVVRPHCVCQFPTSLRPTARAHHAFRRRCLRRLDSGASCSLGPGAFTAAQWSMS